jgi:hypothetical protein
MGRVEPVSEGLERVRPQCAVQHSIVERPHQTWNVSLHPPPQRSLNIGRERDRPGSGAEGMLHHECYIHSAAHGLYHGKFIWHIRRISAVRLQQNWNVSIK